MSGSDDGTSNMSMSAPDADRGQTINTVQGLMMLTSAAAVFLRFLARRIGGAKLWWDDWCILAAWIFCLGVNISILNATSHGLGKHIWNVSDGGHDYLRAIFILELLFTPAVALNKLGVLLMYHRVFAIERSFQIWVRVLGAIVLLWWIGVEVATLLQCSPLDKFWEYQKPGHCVDLIIFFAASALPNVIIDILVLLLPQPYIRNLNMSWPSKIALCAIFFLGAFTALTSVGRLTAIVAYNGGYDFSFSSFTAIIWFSLEPAVGIISACLPTFGPLLRRLPGSPFGAHSPGSRTDVSRGTGGGVSNRGSRLRGSSDTESVRHLTALAEPASKTSVRASVRTSLDGSAWPGTYELNPLPPRKGTNSMARKHS